MVEIDRLARNHDHKIWGFVVGNQLLGKTSHDLWGRKAMYRIKDSESIVI